MKYIFLFTTLILFYISKPNFSLAAAQSGAKTTIKASIPAKGDLRVFGYTAPNSLVQAEGVRVFAQVPSDKDGYFIIDPLPVSREAKELCLTTIDREARMGFPLCIKIPESDRPTEIGPLLLSPTISLSKGFLVEKQTALASGLTLKEAEVEIFFFDSSNLPLALISSAYASSLPKISTKTDQNGSYSINLPTSRPVAFRIFAKAFYNKAPTPKSQTLAFSVTTFTQYWLKNILPKLILLVLFLLLSIWLLSWERKTKKGRLVLASFNETRLKPFVVRSRLVYRRLMYNLQEYLRSHQK